MRHLRLHQVLVAAVLRIHQSAAVYQHKPLWPLDARDWAGATLGALTLIAAALGGVGGGGILLPIYILVLGFRVKQAVALANATILGGAIANVLFAARQRHPYADRPSTNWTLILLFEPLVVCGSVLGAFCNKLLPDALLQTILVALYGSLSYTTMRKAVAQVHEEGGWGNLCKRLPPAGDQPQQQRQRQQQQQQQQDQGELGRLVDGGRPRGQSYPPALERSPWPAKKAGRGGGGCGSSSGNYGTVPATEYDSDMFNGGYSSSEEAKVPSPPPVVKRRVVQRVRRPNNEPGHSNASLDPLPHP